MANDHYLPDDDDDVFAEEDNQDSLEAYFIYTAMDVEDIAKHHGINELMSKISSSTLEQIERWFDNAHKCRCKSPGSSNLCIS